MQGCGGPHRGIDGVLTALGAGKRSKRQDTVFIEAGHRMYRGHGEFVARQGAGLVDAQDVQAGGFIDRGEAGRKHAGACQGLRSDRGRKRKCRGQCDRHRGENRDQHQRNGFGQRHADLVGVDHQQHGDGAIEAGKIAHDPKHRLLLGADDIGGADEFRGTPEFGADAGGEHFGNSFAAPDQGAGIGFRAWPGLDRQGLAGEHGLIEQDRTFRIRTSAATTVPSESLTMSPGTSSAAGKIIHSPSRRTEAFRASLDFSAAIVDWARLS